MTESTPKYVGPKTELERKRLDSTLFKILEDHLHGVGRGILRARLEDLCNDEKQGGKDALTLYNDAHISKSNAEKLTRLLCVSEEFEEPDTLFAWIKTLSRKNYGHRHLEDFYHLLQEVKPRKSSAMPLFLTTLTSAIAAIYLSIRPDHMQVVEDLFARLTPIAGRFLSKTFSVLKNIPLLLIIYYTLLIPAQTFHSIFRDTFRTPFKRFQKWLAGTLPSALSLTAYTLCYAAKGVFTPLAVGFAITSSLIGVVNSLFNFHVLKPIGDKPEKTASLEEKLDYIRQQERKARSAKTVGVNLVASLLISVSVILWALLPPSFPVVIGSMIFITLVGFTKSATLSYIHTKNSEFTQKNLHEVTVDNDPTAPQNTQQHEKNNTQTLLSSIEELHQKVDALKTEVQSLKSTPKPAQSGSWLNWGLSMFGSGHTTEDTTESDEALTATTSSATPL